MSSRSCSENSVTQLSSDNIVVSIEHLEHPSGADD
jgi:hypothetical protein